MPRILLGALMNAPANTIPAATKGTVMAKNNTTREIMTVASGPGGEFRKGWK
jgi:hypothetical protein